MPYYRDELHGVSLSQAAAEVASVAPVGVVLWETFELRHPAFDGPIRVVNKTDGQPLRATLEAGAPAQGGQEVEFVALPVSARLPEESDQGRSPELIVELDGVSGHIAAQLDLAIQALDPVEVTFRLYVSSDTTAPAMLPVLNMILSDVVVGETRVTATARFMDPVNRGFPAKDYTRAEYPGLVSGVTESTSRDLVRDTFSGPGPTLQDHQGEIGASWTAAAYISGGFGLSSIGMGDGRIYPAASPANTVIIPSGIYPANGASGRAYIVRVRFSGAGAIHLMQTDSASTTSQVPEPPAGGLWQWTNADGSVTLDVTLTRSQLRVRGCDVVNRASLHFDESVPLSLEEGRWYTVGVALNAAMDLLIVSMDGVEIYRRDAQQSPIWLGRAGAVGLFIEPGSEVDLFTARGTGA